MTYQERKDKIAQSQQTEATQIASASAANPITEQDLLGFVNPLQEVVAELVEGAVQLSTDRQNAILMYLETMEYMGKLNDGSPSQQDPYFTYFTNPADVNGKYNGLGVYNWWLLEGSHTVTRQPYDGTIEPPHGMNVGTGQVMKLVTTGNATSGDPNATNPTTDQYGGMAWSFVPQENNSYIMAVWAKVPAGRTMRMNPSNFIGTPAHIENITPMEGTGDWKLYMALIHAGEGNLQHTGYFVVYGGDVPTPENPCIAYIAKALYCQMPYGLCVTGGEADHTH